MAKVLRYQPVKGRKNYACLTCRRTIHKGVVHYRVSLDDGGQFPKQERACWGCWKAGRISKGTEIELPEVAEAGR